MDRSDKAHNKTSEETVNAQLLTSIDVAITAMGAALKAKGCEKGSLTDLVRLLQLRKELEGERPRHVTARWIDEDEC
jgi:hypothetical protein